MFLKQISFNKNERLIHSENTKVILERISHSMRQAGWVTVAFRATTP